MSEKAEFLLACESKLEKLKREEEFLVRILRDVQKQLGRYKVEALHMSHINLGEAGQEDDDDEDEGADSDVDMLMKERFPNADMLDRAEVINKSELNLKLKNDDEEFGESEESEESEYSD